jgi:hypothetical protein
MGSRPRRHGTKLTYHFIRTVHKPLAVSRPPILDSTRTTIPVNRYGVGARLHGSALTFAMYLHSSKDHPNSILHKRHQIVHVFAFRGAIDSNNSYQRKLGLALSTVTFNRTSPSRLSQ